MRASGEKNVRACVCVRTVCVCTAGTFRAAALEQTGGAHLPAHSDGTESGTILAPGTELSRMGYLVKLPVDCNSSVY